MIPQFRFRCWCTCMVKYMPYAWGELNIMPPRKTSTKNAKISLNKTTTSRRATATQQVHSCDGCRADIPETEALNCCECGVWLHRYYAGVPNRHYATIATLLIWAACSLTTSKLVILDLRGKIEALKAEVLELRTAMEEMKLNSQQQASANQVNKKSVFKWNRQAVDYGH